MARTKELGKYEVVPTLEQLMGIVEFFQKHATSVGRVNFTQSQMLESPLISEHFNSPSYLNGVNTYLVNEGYITKVQIGSRHQNSVWDVAKLLKDWESVPTREDLGVRKPVRDEQDRLIVPKDVEVEVVRNKKKEEPVFTTQVEPEVTIVKPEPQHNSEILAQLKDAMSDMMGYLQNLPVEMGGHLRSISNQLELTDEDALERYRTRFEAAQENYGNLQIKYENDINSFKTKVDEIVEEKNNLEEEIIRLQTELEEANGKASFNTHHIYRQRNAIMDEVDRMVNSPAWTIKQNKEHYRTSIETKLDEIMSEIGIEKE